MKERRETCWTAKELTEAMKRGELKLVYQPQVHLHTGRIVGVEALLRWSHPQEGAVSPESVVQAALRNGIGGELDDYVLHRALADAKRTQLLQRVHLCVNASAYAVDTDRWLKRVDRALDQWNVERGQIVMELTEQVAPMAVCELQKLVRSLRDLGVQVALDDFGMGMNQLQSLRALPLEWVKMDGEWTRTAGDDPVSRQVLASLTTLGDRFQFQVLAEGVETDEQLHILKELGCRYGQGFGLGRPVRAGELTQLFELTRKGAFV